MDNFKTNYNYIVFGLRVLFLIIFIGLFFIFIFKAIPHFLADNTFSFNLVLGLIAGLFLTLFLPYRFIKILLTERNNIIIRNHQLFLIDSITSEERFVNKSDIKGFSTSVYQTNAWDFKTIIFYFSDGKKIEFPQFLYWNFKEIEQQLIDNRILYLGHEPYRWKWFDTRHYLFD